MTEETEMPNPFLPKQASALSIPNAYEITFRNPHVGNQTMHIMMERVVDVDGVLTHQINPNPYFVSYPEDDTVAEETLFSLIDENKQPTEEMMSLKEFKRALASVTIWAVTQEEIRKAEMQRQVQDFLANAN
jgi:hypothetical protein